MLGYNVKPKCANIHRFLIRIFSSVSVCLHMKKKANSQNIMNKKTVLKPQQQQQSLGAERKKTRAINTKMETEVV